MLLSLSVCLRYLGNGSGAASPSVQHHSILMSFLQHLILSKGMNSQLIGYAQLTQALYDRSVFVPCVDV